MIRAEERALALASPTAAQVEALDGWLREVAARAERVDARGLSFLVLTPLALPWRARLGAELAKLGVAVRGRLALPAWHRVSTAIRVGEPEPGERRVRAAALFEGAWSAIAPQGCGEAWALDAARDHGRVERAKRAIRSGMRSLRVDFGVDGEEPRLLTPFHLADGPEAEAEARRVLAAVAMEREGGRTWRRNEERPEQRR